MCKISVITPAFNAANYIDETVQSVIAQTFSDWEMIIVDDASTDDTYQKITAWTEKDSRIKAVRLDKNSGVAAARNAALDNASGDFIAFLDADDLWLPEKLEKQYNFMRDNGYVLTYTEYKTFATNDRSQTKHVRVPHVMTYNSIFKNTAIACLTVMVDRKTAGDFRMPPLSHTEDQCTWQDILSRGYKAYALCEPLSLYRQGNGSLTDNKLKVIKRQWYTYRSYHKLSVVKSAYYFIAYATNAVIKHFF